jgi:hypothetical protein
MLKFVAGGKDIIFLFTFVTVLNKCNGQFSVLITGLPHFLQDYQSLISGNPLDYRIKTLFAGPESYFSSIF